MGVHLVIVHFRLGISIVNHPLLGTPSLGTPHMLKPPGKSSVKEVSQPRPHMPPEKDGHSCLMIPHCPGALRGQRLRSQDHQPIWATVPAISNYRNNNNHAYITHSTRVNSTKRRAWNQQPCEETAKWSWNCWQCRPFIKKKHRLMK